jgi:hypothetical protein
MSNYEDFNDNSNYNSIFNEDINESVLMTNFIKLLDIYHLLFNKNIMTKKINYMNFIYYQGLKALKHIFIFLLHHTRNYTFTYYHCEKGIYYFTEFISQIENENSFLKLSSIDAIIFVYKKTIYNINKKISNNTRDPIVEKINSVINLMFKIISIKNYNSLKENKIIEKITNMNEKDISELEIIIEQQKNKYTNENTLIEQLKQVLSR